MTRRRMLAATAMLAVPALMLASCGNDDGDDGGDKASGGDKGKIGLVFDIGGKGDKSFNDAASKGLNEAADELGYETKELEPDEGGQNRAELLESLASGGYNPVIGVGFLFADSVLETAQAHPDTTFAIVDNAYGIAGAQPAEMFTQTLERAWSDAHPSLQMVDAESDQACGPDGCAI